MDGLIAAVALFPLWLSPPQEPPAPPQAPQDGLDAVIGMLEGHYPPVAHGRVVLFYSLKGAVDAGGVRASLRELKGDLLRGPSSSGARPGHAFVAIEVESGTDPKAVRKALGKGGIKVEELEWFAFDGRTGDQGAGAMGGLGRGFAGRDFVIGMSSDIRWYETLGTYSQVYCVAGKMQPKELLDRYAKLYEPFGGGKLGSVRRDTLRWSLAAEPDAAQAKILAKAIAKLEGVQSVRFDGTSLELDLDLSGLKGSNPPAALPEGVGRALRLATGDGFSRATFATDALHALLSAAGFSPLEQVSGPPEAPPADGGG